MTNVAIPCLRCRATTHVAADAQSANCQACGFAMPPPGSPAWMAAREGGQPFGPYDIRQVAAYLAQGQILPTDGLWHQGATEWVPAGQLSALAGATAQPQGAAPQPQPPAAPASPYGQAPYGQPAPAGAGPYGGPAPFSAGVSYGTHIKRAFDWNLRNLPIDPSEDAQLQAAGIVDETAKRYIVWRRSVLMAIIIPLGIGAALGVLDLFNASWQSMSALGILVLLARTALLFVLPVTAYLAAQPWLDQRKSRRLLLIGWVISFAGPLLLALIPAAWQANTQGMMDPTQLMQANAALSLGGAMMAYVTLMPAVLSLIPGVVRGCLRIKSLLPTSILPGMFLIAATPLYILLFMVIFTTVNQVAGHFLLILAVLAIAAAPILYLKSAGTFIRPIRTDEEFAKIGSVQNQVIIVMGIGLALLVLWAFVAQMFGMSLIGTNAQTSIMRPWDPQLFQLPLEYIGRSLFTTVAVADLFMLMNVALWKNSKLVEGTPEGAAYDHVMGSIEETGGAGLVQGNTIFRSRGQ